MIIDEEAYLEHFGVKGMKWGVRRAQKNTARLQKRINRTHRIATGRASLVDRALGSAYTKGGANRQLQRWANNRAKLNSGRHRVSKTLLKVQGINYKDLKYPGKKGNPKAKMDSGQKVAVAALAAYGALSLTAMYAAARKGM